MIIALPLRASDLKVRVDLCSFVVKIKFRDFCEVCGRQKNHPDSSYRYRHRHRYRHRYRCCYQSLAKQKKPLSNKFIARL